MPGKETSFNISFPTLILVLVSFISGAVGFGSMVSSLNDIRERVARHDIQIESIDEKLNRLIGQNEAMQEQVRRLNVGIERIK